MRDPAPIPGPIRTPAPHSLSVEIASGRADVEASMRLRCRVFAAEMGARVAGAPRGLDEDGYDAFCHHLLDVDRIPSRDQRHCLDRAWPTQGRPAHEFPASHP